jgi:hypothetical protein
MLPAAGKDIGKVTHPAERVELAEQMFANTGDRPGNGWSGRRPSTPHIHATAGSSEGKEQLLLL